MADRTEAVVQRLRRDFEAAMRVHYPIWSFAPDGCGGYHNERTELAWQGWMACFLHLTADGVEASQAPSEPKLLEYHEIEAIVAEVRAKYPNSQQAMHYAADRAQRAVLARNAGVAGAPAQTFPHHTPMERTKP